MHVEAVDMAEIYTSKGVGGRVFGDADRGRVSFQWDREGACSHRGPKTEPSHAFTCAKTLRAKRVCSGVRCDWHNRRKFRTQTSDNMDR